MTNFCYSLGNPFSLRRSELQSTESLLVANTVWTNVFFCALLLLTHTTMLLPNRFLTDPDRKPSALFILKKLVRRTYRHYIASIMLMITWAEIVAYSLPENVHWLKLNFYVGTILIHIYSAGIDMATRSIFSEETCQGKSRRARLLAAATCTHGLRPSISTSRASLSHQRSQDLLRRYHHNHGSFWRIFIQTFPKVLAAIFAGIYVQLASHSDLFEHALAIMAFAIVSFVVKLVMQELAKRYAMRHRIEQVRFLCILVGVPTVLIDTQVRIVLLGVQGARFAVMGSLVMAVAEIFMRLGKMVLLKFEIRRMGQATQQRATATARSPRLSVSPHSDFNRVHPASTERRREISSRSEAVSLASFERWKKRRLDFHTAETIADMYAEYIAIGCSGSILYFFSSHPKYQYGEQSLEEGTTASAFSTSSSQLQSLAFQTGLEAIVDFVACTFEIAAGAKFESVRTLSLYLAFMFMTIAVVNIGISCFLYLK